jgi:tol-pal system protein YbgF
MHDIGWRRWRGALAAASLLLSGCAGADGERRLGQEIAALRAEIEEMRRAQALEAPERVRLADAVKSLDDRSAAAAREATATAAEIARVKGALAETERSLRHVQEALDETLKRLVEVAAAPPPPPVTVAPPAPPPPRPPAVAAPPPAPTLTAEKLFATAMASFRSDEHGQAVMELGELIQKFPQHPLAASAQYWIAEAYYRQRDYRQALVEFQRVEERYPKGREVPDALLRQGLCHRAIRDTAGARDAWQRLNAGYPSSPAAATARALLSGLSASSASR